MKSWLKIGYLLVMIVFASQVKAATPSNAELDDLFAVRGISYQQDDQRGGKGGNPHLREAATIYEGILLYRHRVNDNNAVQGKLVGDKVTAASYDDAKDKAEIVSGATGNNPGRYELQAGWIQQHDNWGWNASIAESREYAYISDSLSLGWNGSFAEQATQLSLQLTMFDDWVRMIRYDGTHGDDDVRRTVTLNMGWVQSLTPESAVQFGWSHTHQEGFLATTFNTVLVESSVGDADVEWFDFERLPDRRRRDALSVRYKQAVADDSWQLGYSYYLDSWDLQGHTLEARYFAHFNQGRMQLEPVYRYYRQQAARYFSTTVAAPRTYQTMDSDLGKFDGHSTGLTASFAAATPGLSHDSWYDIGVQYYNRSDDINFYWFTVGWRYPRQ
nr:DUF3570 domain-containing protein [Oceanobacter mangrovi]